MTGLTIAFISLPKKEQQEFFQSTYYVPDTVINMVKNTQYTGYGQLTNNTTLPTISEIVTVRPR